MLLREQANFDLAVRLRETGASIGEVYSFISELYFRGKLAYSMAFHGPPTGIPGALIITPGAGLVPTDFVLSADRFITMASVEVDEQNPDFRAPLQRDARLILEQAGPDCQFVLLGSVATSKYVTPLLEIFGDNLVFPSDFAGRGDMSRGGLLLRSARSGLELNYVSVATASLHGPRPPRLPKLTRR